MMKILEQIRTKFGLSDSTPDSAALTQALGDLNRRMNLNREAAARVEAELPAAVVMSIDAGAAERRKIQALASEHGGLEKAVAAIRSEIAQALAREAATDLEAREQKLQPLIEAHAECARKLADARKVVADLEGEVRRRDGELRFEQSIVHDFRLHVNALHKPKE